MRGIVGDVDIDFADRTQALKLLDHVPAAIIRNNTITKHNTGVYFHAVPTDPIRITLSSVSIAFLIASLSSVFMLPCI